MSSRGPMVCGSLRPKSPLRMGNQGTCLDKPSILPAIRCLGVSPNWADRGGIAVAAPGMKGGRGLGATAFGIAVSAFFWVYAPVQLLVGWLCDRFSVYRLMAGGIVLWAASTLLIGFVGGFASLLVLRVMPGVGESIAFPGTSKIIAMNVPPEQRGMANAAVAAGLALGPAIGTLTGGLIVATLGWRAMFIISTSCACRIATSCSNAWRRLASKQASIIPARCTCSPASRR